MAVEYYNSTPDLDATVKDSSLSDPSSLEKSLMAGMRSRYDYADIMSYRQGLRDLVSQDIGEVTSLDDIINPDELLNKAYYRNTKNGQAAYNSDRNMLLTYAERQKAAYDNWYNSESQKAARQRDAGLNPNLNGVSSSDSAAAEVPSDSPISGMTSSEDTFLQGLSVVGGIVGTIANVASLPFQIGSIRAATKSAQVSSAATQVASEGIQIDNLQKFQALAYGDIAAQFADATSKATDAFDVDAWFANTDFTPVLDAYAPSDNPQYRLALERARNQVMKVRGDAYKLGSDKEFNQSNFAKLLSDPYHDDDLAIQVSYLEPVMSAIEQHRLMVQDYETKLAEIRSKNVVNVEQAQSDSAIAEYNYKTDYFKGFEGDEVALYEFMLKQSQALASRAESQVLDNWYQGWHKNPNSLDGARYAYLILNKNHLHWYEYLAHMFTSPDIINDHSWPSDPSVDSSSDPGTAPLASSFLGVFSRIFGRDRLDSSWPYNGMPRSRFGNRIKFGD